MAFPGSGSDPKNSVFAPAVEDRVVVITGVTGRVGRGIARAFAQSGAHVVGTGRRRDRGEAFERSLRSEGHDVRYVPGDVRRVDDCRCVIEAAVRVYGRLDVLINNAGTVGEDPVVDSHKATEAWWDEIVDTNLKGAFFCSRYALAPMIKQRSGTIINVSSTMAITCVPTRMAAYVASKAGLITLTQTMAVEYADYGLRMNVIVLGGAEGENFYKMSDARERQSIGAAYVPQPYDERDTGRMSGEELAQTLMYLCRPEARHINGASIAVDAAFTAGLFAIATPVVATQ